jgi:hypothetical protein
MASWSCNSLKNTVIPVNDLVHRVGGARLKKRKMTIHFQISNDHFGRQNDTWLSIFTVHFFVKMAITDAEMVVA